MAEEGSEIERGLVGRDLSAKKPRVPQAIPQEEYQQGIQQGITRRRFLGWAGIGIAAAAAGLFGLGKAFEKAWMSKEPGIEQGKEIGDQTQRSRKKEKEVGEQPPTPQPTPPLWERTAVPAGQEPTPSPKLNPPKIKSI